VSELQFTGERIHPDLPEWAFMFQAHLFGYRHFLSLAQPRWDVVDVGSGEGYGADLIAQSCRSCTGIDYSAEAIEHARHRYSRDNLRFEQGLATQLPVADCSTDAVTSLQVIEHIDDVRGYLIEIHRILRPGGLVYITTPNRLVLSQEVLDNEFHVRDYSPDELHREVSAVFADVSVLGQAFRDDSARVRAYRQAREEDLRRKRHDEAFQNSLRGHVWRALPPRLRVPLRRVGHAVMPPRSSHTQAMESRLLAEDFVATEDASGCISLMAIGRRP
jgi:ubiquinone/menaquinone biosynthesis C-methylase UbiE